MDFGPNTRLSQYIVDDYQANDYLEPGIKENPFRMQNDWPDPIVVNQNDQPGSVFTNLISPTVLKNNWKVWLSEVYGSLTSWCTQSWHQFWTFYNHLQIESSKQNQLTYNKCWECGRSLENNTGQLSHSWRQKYCPPCWELYRQDLVNEICAQIFFHQNE